MFSALPHALCHGKKAATKNASPTNANGTVARALPILPPEGAAVEEDVSPEAAAVVVQAQQSVDVDISVVDVSVVALVDVSVVDPVTVVGAIVVQAQHSAAAAADVDVNDDEDEDDEVAKVDPIKANHTSASIIFAAIVGQSMQIEWEPRSTADANVPSKGAACVGWAVRRDPATASEQLSHTHAAPDAHSHIAARGVCGSRRGPRSAVYVADQALSAVVRFASRARRARAAAAAHIPHFLHLHQ